jgi:hypothetical protein
MGEARYDWIMNDDPPPRRSLVEAPRPEAIIGRRLPIWHMSNVAFQLDERRTLFVIPATTHVTTTLESLRRRRKVRELCDVDFPRDLTFINGMRVTGFNDARRLLPIRDNLLASTVLSLVTQASFGTVLERLNEQLPESHIIAMRQTSINNIIIDEETCRISQQKQFLVFNGLMEQQMTLRTHLKFDFYHDSYLTIEVEMGAIKEEAAGSRRF